MMVILLCGKICSGKTTYARELHRQRPPSVVLSCDNLMLTLFPKGAGEWHDALARRAQQYLYRLSLDLLATGADVILNWGFWTKRSRADARTFYEGCGIPCSCHYVDAPPDVWQHHIEMRNRAVSHGTAAAYVVDEGLIAKLESRFEPPAPDEIDVLYRPD